ncbi:MAG: threonine aldolase family protein [Parafannyhessea sp.]|uniref:threonine aldolase family protein n=1 Tax=Parafannyhessea sp. TaxID=2847324 RepID=UPI003F128E7D
MEKLDFQSDYLEGCADPVMERLVRTNHERSAGYGLDAHCEHARELVREACAAPGAEVHFLVGGTQVNEVAIFSLLGPCEGVIAATSGHVSVHEAGAIEAGGHKVIELAGHDGKLAAADIDGYMTLWEKDGNRDHMVQPALVYISQPNEYGLLYLRAEFEELRRACDAHGLRLYVDGARLAYALGAPENDVTLPDLARLADAFYIGGTKCGTLFGEALVFPRPGTVRHFFTIAKQRGALLAKGRLLGVQFEALLEDGLYGRIGQAAVAQARRVSRAFEDAGCGLAHPTQTNQVFPVLTDEQAQRLGEVALASFWEKPDLGHTVVRLATSWSTTDAEVDALVSALGSGILG